MRALLEPAPLEASRDREGWAGQSGLGSSNRGGEKAKPSGPGCHWPAARSSGEGVPVGKAQAKHIGPDSGRWRTSCFRLRGNFGGVGWQQWANVLSKKAAGYKQGLPVKKEHPVSRETCIHFGDFSMTKKPSLQS